MTSIQRIDVTTIYESSKHDSLQELMTHCLKESISMRGADLRSANLRCANLRGADLRGANLLGAKGIYSFGPIGEDQIIVYVIEHETRFMVRLGRFWGTQAEAIETLQKKYGIQSIYEDKVNLGVEILSRQK